MKLKVLLSLILVMTVAHYSSAADWPQWQGPDRNAISKETGLLGEWPEGGPPLAWRINELGGGYSAPAIAAGRIFGMSKRGEDEVVWALSEADGSEQWVTRLGPATREGRRQGSEGPGCTPTVDGDRLYVLGAGGELACLLAQDGKIVWRLNLIEDLDGRLPVWRYNESPLVDGDKVICTPGGEDATLVALDKMTGKLIWKSNVSAAASDRRRAEGGPSMMQIMPVLAGLDADGNREISANEINNSPSALAKLDKNQDGKLTEDEVAAETGGRGDQRARGGRNSRGGRGGMMRMMPFLIALDADENREIGQAEINNAAAALRTLDKNSDGNLTEDEVRPQFGGSGPTSEAAYSSAIAIDFEGQRQYVQLTATALVGVAADNGEVLWNYDRPANDRRINCSTPIYRDGIVFAASAYGNGGGAVALRKDASGAVSAEEIYFTRSMQNHHGGMIVVDGCLYGASGGSLTCLDFKTGELLWRDRAAPKGSLILADERLYWYSERGAVILIEPDREEYKERGRFEQPDRSDAPAWTHPVIANGKLYIRDQDLLLCYDVQAK